MDLVIIYRNKKVLIDIDVKDDFFTQIKDDFYYTHRNIYLLSKTGGIKISNTEEGYYLYYKRNGIMWVSRYADGIDTINRTIEHLERQIDDINIYVDNSIESLYDTRGKTNNERLNVLNNINKEYDEIIRQNRIEKERKEQEKKLEYERIKQESIKDAINDVKNNEYIESEEFELLIKHFDIYIHPKTLGFIRKHLNYINKNSYHSTKGRKSDKVYEIYDEILEKINGDNNEG